MSITLPTLDELEAWWEAHPQTFATTCDETACVTAMPLHERYPDATLGVIPSRTFGDGLRREGAVRLIPCLGAAEIAVPLPDDLNSLAKEFDELRAEWDDNDNEMDEQQSISAAECLALIREMKGAK